MQEKAERQTKLHGDLSFLYGGIYIWGKIVE